MRLISSVDVIVISCEGSCIVYPADRINNHNQGFWDISSMKLLYYSYLQRITLLIDCLISFAPVFSCLCCRVLIFVLSILAKSSNWPSAFHWFSSKCKMTWLHFLHLEIARRVLYPRQWRYWQHVQQYMQDAHLNSGTTIFKIRILAQFVSHDFLK